MTLPFFKPDRWRTVFANRLRSSGSVLVALAVLSGCAALRTPDNREPVREGLSYQAEFRSPQGPNSPWRETAKVQNRQRCTEPTELMTTKQERLDPLEAQVVLLSEGDLLDIAVDGDDSFSGTMEVSQDGRVYMRHLPPIQAAGRSPEALQHAIAQTLLAADFYTSEPRVSVRLQDAAAARVFVSGAVFVPGAVTIGGAGSNDRDAMRQAAPGAVTNGRRLSQALQNAGGVRPDADLSAIRLERNGQVKIIDARAALKGAPFADPVLVSGDLVSVESRGCFQHDLVVPSSITPPGVKVFMANIDNSALPVSKEARELRYGTRMLQAAVGMNCAGGSKAVNAHRSVALITRNPLTDESVVIERPVEQLIRNADRDDFNPFIMPEDALVCYDSKVSNAIDITKAVGSIATTLLLTAQ